MYLYLAFVMFFFAYLWTFGCISQTEDASIATACTQQHSIEKSDQTHNNITKGVHELIL
jgi:hypothetical protein